MRSKKIKNSDYGVVGIVATFLILGLVVVVISTIQTVYIPQWMEQAEADHMETVSDQFSQLKFAIDTHAAIKQPDTPITTSITLGNKELPILSSSRTYGNLEIIPHQCTVIITDDSKSYPYHLGGIKYSSSNTYFLDQTYTYETGAILVEQTEGNTMTTKPVFTVSKEKNTTITITLVNISTIGEKKAVGGYGTYPIQTEYSHSDIPFAITNVSNITITTDYQNAWEKFINQALINGGLDPNDDFLLTRDDNGIVVAFTDTTIVNLDLKFIEVKAQIAPGWIENIKG
jgi:hypothetical protein